MLKELITIELPKGLQHLLGLQSVIVYSYAACVVMGAIIACLLIGQRHFAKFNAVLPYTFYYVALLWGWVGGKLFFLLENIDWYFVQGHWSSALLGGGLVCYGSIICISLYTIWFAKKNGLQLWRFIDNIALYAPIPVAYGRLGCFLNGCCYGKASSSIVGMHFPHSVRAVHPTQLYEIVLLIGIFICLLRIAKMRNYEYGTVFATLLLTYGIGRSIIELFRGDARGYLFNGLLSQAQFIAMLTAIPAIFLLVFLNKISFLTFKKNITT